MAQVVKNLPAKQETWVQSRFGKIPWRREWLPTPGFFPGEFHGWRSIAGFSPWGHKELDRIEQLTHKVLESPLDCKEIKPANPKGNQSWIFIGRADAEAEAPVLWPPDAKSRFIRKDSDAGKGWRQENRTTEDEMVEWHHWLNGHEFEQAPGDGKGQRSRACCSLWGHEESDTIEQLNNR